MSITFSSGGFDGTMRSDASGNIFIETAGNNKSINIGGLIEYTGSIEKRLDKATGKVIEETEKDIASGKTFHRSSSATTNQIEFQQNSQGAFIAVSGSNPGFTCFMPGVGDRALRARGDIYVSASQVLSTGVNMDGSSLDYYIHMNHIGAIATTQDFGDANGTGYLMVSQSGDTKVSKNLIVDGNVTGSLISTGSFARVENVNKLVLSTQTIAAAGSNQGDATAIDSNGGSTVFVTDADNAKGVLLPVVADSTIGQKFTIINTLHNKTLEIYPGSGDKIKPAADNAAITIAASGVLVLIHYSADGWVGYEPAVISA